MFDSTTHAVASRWSSGANLKVERGEVVMIVGAAGVGTSRIVAAALGEVAAAGGSHRGDGPRRREAAPRRRCG